MKNIVYIVKLCGYEYTDILYTTLSEKDADNFVSKAIESGVVSDSNSHPFVKAYKLGGKPYKVEYVYTSEYVGEVYTDRDCTYITVGSGENLYEETKKDIISECFTEGEKLISLEIISSEPYYGS